MSATAAKQRSRCTKPTATSDHRLRCTAEPAGMLADYQAAVEGVDASEWLLCVSRV